MFTRRSTTCLTLFSIAVCLASCGDSEGDAPAQMFGPVATADAGAGAANPPAASNPPNSSGSTGGNDAGSAPAASRDSGAPVARLDAGGSNPPASSNDAGSVSAADAGAIGDASTSDAGAPISAGGSCLMGITDYQKAGPFKFTPKTSGKIKFWVPMVPAGCKVPVVHLANGTTATCSNYQGSLERLASHGFLTACYEDPDTGAGSQGLMALETAFSMFPDLADNRIGSTGHSQGGQAAFTVLQLAEQKWGDKMIYAGLAMQPASGFGEQPTGGSWQQVYAKIKSPMFMFSGTADVLVSESWVQQAFDALDNGIEAYWWSAIGATHIPTPVEPENQVSIPWFRWKLLGDQKACEFFKKMPDGPDWDKKKSQNEKPCM